MRAPALRLNSEFCTQISQGCTFSGPDVVSRLLGPQTSFVSHTFASQCHTLKRCVGAHVRGTMFILKRARLAMRPLNSTWNLKIKFENHQSMLISGVLHGATLFSDHKFQCLLNI